MMANDTSLDVSFGEWVQKRRQALDMTREQLAQGVGCSVSALRKIEGDERRPSRQLAELLADCLQIPGDGRDTFLQVARGQQRLERLAAALGEVAAAPPLAPHLPQPPTPLVGRETELAALARLLHTPSSRLVTIIGPGGVGKTRLALALAAGQMAHFGDGTYFVSLAGLAAPQFIPTAVAEAIGFAFSGPSEPRAQLLNHLAGKRLLMLLDNVEHLLDGVELLAEMMQVAPEMKLLVTSRERLNLTGEWVFDLQGLPTPPPDEVEDAETYSAVALFVQAARRVRADFVLTAADHTAVTHICQLVEGMPLALELAATWVRLLSCAEIAAEIERGLDFLSSTMRDAPPRQRSLRATFDYSWNLLSPGERRILCQLAVFQGGFTREAAAQVAGATLPDLLSLVSKSLLRRAEDGRYDLHQIIRQYARIHLGAEPAQEVCTRDRHSEHYLQLVAAQEKTLKSAAQQDALRQLTRDADNIRAAWQWAVERKEFALLGTAVHSLGEMFEVSGLLREGIAQLELLAQLLRAEGENSEWAWILGRTLTQQGLLNFRSGRFQQAQTLLQESLAVLRPTGERPLLVDPLIYSGAIRYLNGDIETAAVVLHEGLGYAQEAHDEWFVAYAIFILGHIISLKGEHAEGHRQETISIAIWRRLGDPHAIALGLNYSSLTLIQLGQFAEAEANLQESLRLCRDSGNRWGLGTAYRHLGLVKLAQGDLALAEKLLRQALETFGNYIVGWDIACSYTYLGDVMLQSANLPAATENYLKGLRLAQEIQSAPLLLEALVGIAELEQRRGNLERAWVMACVVRDHAASPRVAWGRACRIIRLVQAGPDHEVMPMQKSNAPMPSLEVMVNSLGIEPGYG